MAECDGFFDDLGIPFEYPYADDAVRAVWTADFYDPVLKKWLIMCWFDTTFGRTLEDRFDRSESSAQMKAWLATSKYATFEELLETVPNATYQEN